MAHLTQKPEEAFASSGFFVSTKWLCHFVEKASLCALFGRFAAKSTLAARKVFFPTYTPPEKTI